MVISFISGNIIGGNFGVIFFAIFACYTRAGKSHYMQCFEESKMNSNIPSLIIAILQQSGLVSHLPALTCLPHVLR